MATEIQGEGFTAKHDEKAQTLIVVVDLSREGVPSGSGKTMTVATSRGNRQIDDTTYFGLNVFRYVTPKGSR